MALTIITQPPPLLMAYAPVKFVVHSSLTDLPLRIMGGVYGIGGDSVQADSSKNAAFELSDYLQGLITKRGFTESTPQLYTNVPLPVSFIFAETAGYPPTQYPETETDACYLLDAYIPKSRTAAFYAANSSLLAYLVSSKSCLTWWNSAETKRVLPDQKEFLNYLQVFSGESTTITLSATFTFTDGTPGTSGILFTVPLVDYLALVYFPAGYSQLGLGQIIAQSYPGKILESYTLSIKCGNTKISQDYSYWVDPSWYEFPRVLQIRNSFGLLETILLTGESQQENSVKPEIAVTDGSSLPDKITWKTERENTVKANTGFLTSNQIQWLSEMDFREAYELIGSTLHPIVFKEVKFITMQSGVYQHSADLEYEYAYNEIAE